jgi:TonB family protein
MTTRRDIAALFLLLGVTSPGAARAQGLERFFFDFQVDKPAKAAPGNPPPHYPDSLKAAGIVGTEVLAFMVDTTGHIDVASLRAVNSSHPLFLAAVREALPRLTFSPAELYGHKVRERVTQSFEFSLPGKPAPPAPKYINGTTRSYSNFQVDVHAEPLPGNPEPVYPDSLRNAQVVGRVIALFNVDTLGRVESSSFATIDTWSPLFTQAVRDVLPRLAFVPASLYGHKVRQQVQQRFDFSLPGKAAPEGYSPELAGRRPPAPGAAPPRRPPESSEQVAFQTFFAFQVEKEVTIAPGSPMPRYPDVLRQSQLSGEVLAQFVVDTLGHPQVGSFRVLQSAHELLSQAVRAALPEMKFTPAEVNGHRVQQLMQHKFTFEAPKP